MSTLPSHALRTVPAVFGVFTLVSVGALLAYDASPHLFPVEAHDFLAALPLVLIAVAYVVYQGVRGASIAVWGKTAILSLAFLFWAANQLSTDRWLATLFNDMAIAGFVVDVFLVIVGPPPWPDSRQGGQGQGEPKSFDGGKEPLESATVERP